MYTPKLQLNIEMTTGIIFAKYFILKRLYFFSIERSNIFKVNLSISKSSELLLAGLNTLQKNLMYFFFHLNFTCPNSRIYINKFILLKSFLYDLIDLSFFKKKYYKG